MQNRPWIGANWLFFRKGSGATNHFEGGGFARSNDDVAYPNLMFHFLPIAIRYDGSVPAGGHGYQVHIGPMYSDTRGSVKIKSTDPKVHPALRFNYLSTAQDRPSPAAPGRSPAPPDPVVPGAGWPGGMTATYRAGVDQQTRDEIAAGGAAHRELGPAYDHAVAEGLVERIGDEIDRRVDARLAQRGAGPSPAQHGSRQVTPPALPAWPMIFLALRSMTIGGRTAARGPSSARN